MGDVDEEDDDEDVDDVEDEDVEGCAGGDSISKTAC